MPDIETVLARLSEQCTTAEEVRRFFILNNVTGKTVTFSQCPVARYLTQETGERWGVTAYAAEKITNYVDPIPPCVKLPEQVTDFIHMFDDGQYEELVSDDDAFFWENRNKHA